MYHSIDTDPDDGGAGWERIDDIDVRHVWVPTDTCLAECETRPAVVPPDWYAENGTPICDCGDDMEYSHTEVRRKTNNKQE